MSSARHDWLDQFVDGTATDPFDLEPDVSGNVHEQEEWLMHADWRNVDQDTMRRIGGAFLLLWRKKCLEGFDTDAVEMMVKCLDTAVLWEFG